MAQLRASLARARGVLVVPVWNKSQREHALVGSAPPDVRREADHAVAALGWDAPYHVDADHLGLDDDDAYLDTHDFFTLDVARFNGSGGSPASRAPSSPATRSWPPPIRIPGIDEPLALSPERLAAIAHTYAPAVREAGRIYRRIAAARGEGRFITEISMDEVDAPQTPEDLLVILAAVADEGIPVQTLAPRFAGRFAKGVDYRGDAAELARDFDRSLCVIRFAARELGLPPGLKLSLHSGSDKPSLYGPIRRALRRHDAGLHLKTAGTTWLEELIGLCEGGGDGLAIVKEIVTPAPSLPRGRALPALRGRASTSIRRVFRRPTSARAGTARRSPPPCGTTRPARATTPTSASSCTWPTSWPRRWARASSTPWAATRRPSPGTSPRTSSRATSRASSSTGRRRRGWITSTRAASTR